VLAVPDSVVVLLIVLAFVVMGAIWFSPGTSGTAKSDIGDSNGNVPSSCRILPVCPGALEKQGRAGEPHKGAMSAVAGSTVRTHV
jgi:hypothetical protein